MTIMINREDTPWIATNFGQQRTIASESVVATLVQLVWNNTLGPRSLGNDGMDGDQLSNECPSLLWHVRPATPVSFTSRIIFIKPPYVSII